MAPRVQEDRVELIIDPAFRGSGAGYKLPTTSGTYERYRVTAPGYFFHTPEGIPRTFIITAADTTTDVPANGFWTHYETTFSLANMRCSIQLDDLRKSDRQALLKLCDTARNLDRAGIIETKANHTIFVATSLPLALHRLAIAVNNKFQLILSKHEFEITVQLKANETTTILEFDTKMRFSFTSPEVFGEVRVRTKQMNAKMDLGARWDNEDDQELVERAITKLAAAATMAIDHEKSEKEDGWEFLRKSEAIMSSDDESVTASAWSETARSGAERDGALSSWEDLGERECGRRRDTIKQAPRGSVTED